MTATPSTNGTTVPTFGVNILREALAKAHRQAPEHGSRLDRAANIVALRNIERISGGWLVESEREPGSYYLVSQDGMGVRCICLDYRNRGGLLCKHILAVRLLALCEKLAAKQSNEPIPFPVPTLDPDQPIPFVLTDKAHTALATDRSGPVA
jgi:hypothetical protein